MKRWDVKRRTKKEKQNELAFRRDAGTVGGGVEEEEE